MFRQPDDDGGEQQRSGDSEEGGRSVHGVPSNGPSS